GTFPNRAGVDCGHGCRGCSDSTARSTPEAASYCQPQVSDDAAEGRGRGGGGTPLASWGPTRSRGTDQSSLSQSSWALTRLPRRSAAISRAAAFCPLCSDRCGTSVTNHCQACLATGSSPDAVAFCAYARTPTTYGKYSEL